MCHSPFAPSRACNGGFSGTMRVRELGANPPSNCPRWCSVKAVAAPHCVFGERNFRPRTGIHYDGAPASPSEPPSFLCPSGQASAKRPCVCSETANVHHFSFDRLFRLCFADSSTMQCARARKSRYTIPVLCWRCPHCAYEHSAAELLRAGWDTFKCKNCGRDFPSGRVERERSQRLLCKRWPGHDQSCTGLGCRIGWRIPSNNGCD